jgi:hypothetical protein
MSENKKLFDERLQRLLSAVALEKTDRVPMAPKMNGIYGSAYGLSMYEAMMNTRLFEDGVKTFLERYQPDMVWMPMVYPIPPMETLECGYIRWPGGDFGIPLDKGFQILDGCYIEPEEFGELVFDPTNFILTKLYPRKFKALSGLSKINLQYPCERSAFTNLIAFADPEVRESLYRATVAGEQTGKWFGDVARMIRLIEGDLGFPIGAKFSVTCPFDMFADNMRGIMNVLVDMRKRPDELLEVINKLEVISIRKAVSMLKATGAKFCFIPLHNGVDEFMSRENFLKFYWPGLKNLMTAVIDEGCIPYVFCEGKYNTRLDIIADVPKGKVLYMFEQVDFKQVKEVVGKTACVCGNLDTALLMYGTKEQIADGTKRLIDIGAPGGGFMMDCSIGIEEAPLENLDVFFETTAKYGNY